MTNCGHRLAIRNVSQLIIGVVSAQLRRHNPRVSSDARARLGRFAVHVARACVSPRLAVVTQ